MKADELAILYLAQLHAYDDGAPYDESETNALFLWEEWISDDPERAWPVFDEILSRSSDDDTFEQVWYRLRLLLHRHYDVFHERAAALLAKHTRFAFVAGADALDRERYTETPLDREALVVAYLAMQRAHHQAREVDRLRETDPDRALHLAIEIIHRGVARGWDAFDVMTPLGDLIADHGPRIIDQLEEHAKQSVAVRRVLWRLQRHLVHRTVDEDVRERVEVAMGTTTDYTETEVPAPPPQKQLDADERILDAWFAYEGNFWAFSAISDLVGEEPQLAWSLTLELLERADEEQIGSIAAGPLEDLIRGGALDAIWDEVTTKAHSDPRFAEALRGVWVFDYDGEIFTRFRELMETLDAEPN